MLALDKVDSDFRKLVDQLFFTDRTDLDTSNLSILFDNRDEHLGYLWDRFVRSTEIFWDEAFWMNRFDLLLSWNPKRLANDIEAFILPRFRTLIVSNYSASPKYSNAYIQMMAWTKIKSRRKENLAPVREFLIGLPHIIQVDKLMGIISNFIPHVFQNVEEYLEIISKKIGQSAHNFEILQQLEKQGLTIDRQPIHKLAKDLLFKRVPNRTNKRTLFTIMDDAAVMAWLKNQYDSATHRNRLFDIIKSCDYKEIEEQHLRNIKNLLELDVTVADELLTTYADSLYHRRNGYKLANVKRLIRVCKAFPQFSPKKALAYLASNNRMSDIKHMLKTFPELKTLAPFI